MSWIILKGRILSLCVFRVETTMEPYTNDVQVRRDGVVEHSVILFTTVSCEINLFNYPYVFGECPVAINGWSQKCKLKV